MRGEVQRKKQAFYHQIRSERNNSFFHSVRQQISKEQHDNERIQSDILVLLDQLPSTSVLLVDKLNENFPIVGQILSNSVSQLCQKMVSLEAIDWCHLTYIINRLLVGTEDKKILQKIVGHSILPVLEGSEVLLGAGKLGREAERQTLQLVLDYCLRIGRFVIKLNQLEETALVSSLKRLWGHSWTIQYQSHLLLICFNILSANFDQDQAQNVRCQQRSDLQLMKRSLILGVWYRGNTLQILISRTCMLSTEEEQQRLLVLYLRLLITITSQLDNPCYYYPMLQFHLLHALQSILCLSRQRTSEATILSVKLLNNLLVNDFKLTEQILKEFMVSSLVSLFERNNQVPELQAQIVQLFVNLLHFMNDDEMLVRELVNRGVGGLILKGLEIDEKWLEYTLNQTMSTVMIMLNHHPYEMRPLILKSEGLLRRLAQSNQDCEGAIEQMLTDLQNHYKLTEEL